MLTHLLQPPSCFFFIDIAAQLLRLAARVGDGAAGLSLSAVVGCKTTTTKRTQDDKSDLERMAGRVSAPPPLQQDFGWGERGGGGVDRMISRANHLVLEQGH